MAFLIILLGIAWGLFQSWGLFAGWLMGIGTGWGLAAIMFAVREKRALDAFNQEFADRFAEGDAALSRLLSDIKAGRAEK